MACWGTHLLMDGPLGILPDMPLALAVARERTIHPRRQRWHRTLHHPAALLLAGLAWLATGRRVWLAVARHILLDHLTHRRGWFR